METAAYFAFFFLPAAAIALLLVGAFGFTIDRVKEACCARCRYPVAGLPESPDAVCPECGQPLAGRGTRKPGARVLLRPPLQVACVCRSILVVIPAVYLLAGPASEVRVVVSPVWVKATSRSGLFQSLTIRGSGKSTQTTSYRAWNRLATPRSGVTAILAGPERSVSLRILDGAARVEYDTGGRRTRTPDAVTAADILVWLRAAGVDTTAAAAPTEAAAIVQLLRNTAMGGEELGISTTVLAGLTVTSAHTDVYFRPHAGLILAVIIPAIALWWWLMRDAARRFG